MKRWGTAILVLAQAVPLSGCGGTAQDSAGGKTGTAQASSGGSAGGEIIHFCGDQAYAIATIHIQGAPTEEQKCLASLQLPDEPVRVDVSCAAGQDGCVCKLWSGTLKEGATVITVLDPEGLPNATYSGPYPVAPAVDSCAPSTFEPIVIDYEQPQAGTEAVSCERSGVQEFCAPTEGCCTCGCGVVTDVCLQETPCPPHEGPDCGEAKCRSGMICCDASQSFCAASQEDCPE